MVRHHTIRPVMPVESQTWKIVSTPPGARIWIDGVDTGALTPAAVPAPGPGLHRVRLVLAEYADDELELEAGNLDLTRGLESLAHRATIARMAEDGTRVPDEAERAKTRMFFGKLSAARILVARHGTFGLGGLSIEIRGNGTVTLQKDAFKPHQPAVDHTARLDQAAVDRLFAAFIDEAFTELQIANQPGVPDELYVTVTIRGVRGTHSLGKFASAKHPRFTRLVDLVRAEVIAAVDAEMRKRLTL